MSRRHSRRDNIIDWEPPVNLGCEVDGYVNGPGPDLMPTLFEDEAGTVVMYFGSKRPGSEGLDIYATTNNINGVRLSTPDSLAREVRANGRGLHSFSWYAPTVA